MKKYIFVPTGREANIGDVLVQVEKMFGVNVPVRTIVITKDSLPKLIKEGLIHEVNDDSGITAQSAVKHLAERIGWKVNNLEKYFDNLYKIHPAAVFSVILKEVAIMLDEKYPDHINNSKEIYVISALNGCVTKADKACIKNFKNFAAFRTIEDANRAKKIMAIALKDLYGEQKD